MESADMAEVYKRLAERGAKFLDEFTQELPVPEEHKIEEPLFQRAQELQYS